jgi:hypothetical protein
MSLSCLQDMPKVCIKDNIWSTCNYGNAINKTSDASDSLRTDTWRAPELCLFYSLLISMSLILIHSSLSYLLSLR